MTTLRRQVKLVISVLENAKFSPLAKVVFALLLLKYRNGKTGRCDPSANTIGALVGRHERIVRGAIDELEAAGEIRTLERKGTSSLYSFLRFDDREQPRLKTAGPGPAVFVTPVRLKTAAKPAEENLLSLRERAPQRLRTKASAQRGTRLPHDWSPSQADRELARRHGLSDSQIETQGTKFRNYWTSKPGKAACKLSWSRTWENWVITATEGRRPAQKTAEELPDPRTFSNEDWRNNRDVILKYGGTWPEAHWGPPPGDPGCLMPEPLQLELGLNGGRGKAGAA
jgi:hypothetical protein